MKKWMTGLGLVFAGLSVFGQTTLHVLPAEVEDLTNSHQLVWETEPGVRYELQQSSNLTSWASIAGYPTSAVQYTERIRLRNGRRAEATVLPRRAIR